MRIIGPIFMAGLVTAFVMAVYGWFFGKKHPSWVVRLASPIWCACGLYFWDLCMDVSPTEWANVVWALGTCLLFGGLTTFIASTLSSYTPEYNALLPENQKKPSVKRATWLFILAAFLTGLPAMMLSIVIYNGEFMPGHLLFVALPVVFVTLTLYAAIGQLRGKELEPPKWTLVALSLILVILLIVCFKGPGVLALFLMPFVLAASFGKRS